MSEIDYRYLKAFALTAKCLNFSKAAEELNIAQSAVSRQIKLLEESIGEQLIVRSSKKTMLTEKGKELLKAINSFEEMTLDLKNNTGPQEVKVGILHGLLENWFIAVIKDFAKNSIHSLDLMSDTPVNLKNLLLNGEVDVIFSNENIQSELVTSLGLFNEELALISKKEVDPKDAKESNWIVYSENDFLFDLYKNTNKKVIKVKSVTSIIKLVKAGVGIAIVPEHTVRNETGIKHYPVKAKSRPKIFMATLNYQTLPSHLEELAQTVKNSL